MTREPDDETRRAVEARRRHFTPRWFYDLATARLDLGETFWVGNVGASLIFIPAGFAVVAPAAFISADAVRVALVAVLALLALYSLVVATALARLSLRASAGGWGWAGVAVTALLAAGYALAAVAFAAIVAS